jgi:hypothetical protein
MLITSQFGFDPKTGQPYTVIPGPHGLILVELGSTTEVDAPFPELFTSNVGYDPFTDEAFTSKPGDQSLVPVAAEE